MKSMGDKAMGAASGHPKVAPARERKYDGPIRMSTLPRYELPASLSMSQIVRIAQPQDKLPGGLCGRKRR